MSGSFSGESEQRTAGLKLSIKNHQDVELLQVVPAMWSRERSRLIIHQLSERFGDIDIAWAASDGMALGILDTLASGFGKLNPHLVIGGIDWTIEALEQVKQGKLSASVGGHIMQTAWALVKIYDHHHGVDVFSKAETKKSYDLEVIHQGNIMQYFVLVKRVNWELIDFMQFTRAATGQSQYKFSFELMLDALNK